MKMWFLALRHLSSRKRQTALTLLGILLGTAAYVVISGLLIGFQEFLVDQLVNNDAHLKISAREEVLTPTSLDKAFFPENTLVRWIKPPTGRKDNPYIVSPGTWMHRLREDPRVTGASQQMVVQVIANRGKVTSTAKLIGADPEDQKKVSNIENYMLSGGLSEIGHSGNRVVIGKELLDTLGAAQGETIYLSAGRGAPQPFRVVGVFRIGVKSVDESTMIGAIGDAQKLNQTPGRVTSIAVRLRDVRDARKTAAEWNTFAPEKVETWDQANAGLMSVFSMQDVMRNAMTISILVVASFGIYNILSLAISHKKREIAILRSMGFEPKDISSLFLTQGMVLGGAGGLIGLALGFLFCLYIGTIDVASNRGLGGDKLFMSYDWGIYVKALLLAIASACVASFLPARAAGKMEPIDILRSESE
jgi:lipoprotein-releasing system permease protein